MRASWSSLKDGSYEVDSRAELGWRTREALQKRREFPDAPPDRQPIRWPAWRHPINGGHSSGEPAAIPFEGVVESAAVEAEPGQRARADPAQEVSNA